MTDKEEIIKRMEREGVYIGCWFDSEEDVRLMEENRQREIAYDEELKQKLGGTN